MIARKRHIPSHGAVQKARRKEKGKSHDNYTNTTWIGNGIEYLDVFNDVGQQEEAMTREEAIQILSESDVLVLCNGDTPATQAVDMAIDALSADVVGYESTVTLNSPISIQPEFVAVVRCKDCRYYMKDHEDAFMNIDEHWCSCWAGGTELDGYCYEAERKEP